MLFPTVDFAIFSLHLAGAGSIPSASLEAGRWLGAADERLEPGCFDPSEAG
mgnify:CR=1 FL=1